MALHGIVVSPPWRCARSLGLGERLQSGCLCFRQWVTKKDFTVWSPPQYQVSIVWSAMWFACTLAWCSTLISSGGFSPLATLSAMWLPQSSLLQVVLDLPSGWALHHLTFLFGWSFMDWVHACRRGSSGDFPCLGKSVCSLFTSLTTERQSDQIVL